MTRHDLDPKPTMSLDPRLSPRTMIVALALVSAACGKKTDAAGTAGAPEVSAAGVPDVADGERVDAATREVSRYRLTIDDVRKYVAAAENVKRFAEQHPEVVAQAERDHESEEPDAESSTDFDQILDDFEARVERVPAARRAIESAGLSVREYIIIPLALWHASAAQAVIQQQRSGNPDSLAREYHAHPANVRFVKEHEAELARYKHLLSK